MEPDSVVTRDVLCHYPALAYNLERVFYNRDRLSEPYTREHLFRLRDAYRTYSSEIRTQL